MPVKKTKTVFVFLSLASILFSVFSVLIAPQMASAAVQGEWVDFATIKVGDQLYKDGKPRDSSHDYYLNGNTGDCSSEIDAFEGNKVGATKAKITLKNKDPLTGNCTQSTDTINLSQPLNATIQFYWVDSGTIEGAWSGDGMYKKLPDRNDFALQTNDECKNSVVPSSANATTGVYVIRGQVQTPDPNDSPLNKTCGEESRIDVRIGNAEANASKPPGSGTPTNGGSGSETADDSPSCETASGGSPLVWLICPVIKMLDEAASWLDNQVQSLLVVQNPDSIEEGGVNQLKNAWGRIRNIALIILVPMMLVMVISTALGFSIVDAYTLKKVMPRFLIAVLFISTSFYLMDFLVTITNDVGRGVLGLVTQPFGGSDQTLVDLMSPAAGASLSWGGFLVFGGLALAGLVSFGIILSLAFVTVVALAMGFGILILRQVLILGLLLLAPLAILSWIFPNSVKGWKLWWGSFSKLLLMFPLIMLLIGAGRAFAQIIDGMQVGGEAMQQVMILLAYIAPFFFIPATFKAAGGVFGTIAGMANDRTRGLFDKQRQFRADKRKELHERAGSNNRFNPNNSFVRGLKRRTGINLNSLSSWAASPGSNLAYAGRNVPGLSGKGQKIKTQIESAVVSQSGKAFEELNANGFNDKAYRALSGAYAATDGFSAETRQRLIDAGFMDREGKTLKHMDSLQNIHGMADILQQGNASEAVAANVLRGQAGRLLSYYSDPEMGKASAQAAGMIGLSSHGFASGRDIAAVGNDLIGQGYSPEVAQALVSTAQVAGQRQRPDVKAGYGTVFEGGKFISGTQPGGKQARKLVRTLSSADLASAKAGAIEELRPTIQDTLRDGGGQVAQKVRNGTATQEEQDLYGEAQAVKEQLFSWAGPYSQASVAVKREALDIIDKQSNGRKLQTREVRQRDGSVRTEQYMGYDEGTIGWEFERRSRAETDPTLRGGAPGGGEEE